MKLAYLSIYRKPIVKVSPIAQAYAIGRKAAEYPDEHHAIRRLVAARIAQLEEEIHRLREENELLDAAR